MEACKIISASSGQVVAVSDASNNAATPLIQYPYTGDASQQWKVVSDDTRDVRIVSLSSGQVIAVASASKAPAASLIQYPYSGDPSQRWQIAPVEGTYFKVVSASSHLAMAVSSASQAPGAPLIQYPYTGDNSQKWQVVQIGAGRCQIVSMLSGQVVAVSGASQDPAATLIQYPYSGDLSQQWELIAIGGNRYRIVSASSGQAIAVSDASLDPAARLIQYPYSGDSSQQWELEPIHLVKLVSANGGKEVIAVSSASKEIAAPLIQYGYTGDSSQQWELSKLARNLWNPRIIDVRKVFEAVPDHGQYRHYSGDPSIGLIGHVQGMANYREHYILTHNFPTRSRGRIIIVDRPKGEMVQVLDSPEPDHNHPGGCQVIGDYLAVPLETSSNTEGVVRFYYLGCMDDHTPPRLLPPRLLQGTAGAGAVGITDVGSGANRRYLVAVYDDGAVTFYQSNGNLLDDAACQFTRLFNQRLTGRGADNLCLLTDIAGNVFIIALTSDGDWLVFHDWAELYSVDLVQRTIKLEISRHMFNKGGLIGKAGIHFRYGAGLQILSPTEIWLYCSARNFVPFSGIDVNMYRKLNVSDAAHK